MNMVQEIFFAFYPGQESICTESLHVALHTAGEEGGSEFISSNPPLPPFSKGGMDPAFLDAMRAANIKGALVGIESMTPEGLKDVFNGFNRVGQSLVDSLQTFRSRGIHVLGSFIFGLPSDRPETFDATAKLAQEAGLTFAQFLTLTPFPGTVDFDRWEKSMENDPKRVAGIPLTRHWLIPHPLRPKIYSPHPLMSAEEIRRRTQTVWERFYTLGSIWKRAVFLKSLRGRLTFVLISKIYRQTYADVGIAADSARIARSTRWARWLAKPCGYLFSARPLPQLQVPGTVMAVQSSAEGLVVNEGCGDGHQRGAYPAG